jgi:hypothetical protein
MIVLFLHDRKVRLFYEYSGLRVISSAEQVMVNSVRYERWANSSELLVTFEPPPVL